MRMQSNNKGFASTLVKLFAAATLMLGAMAGQQALAGSIVNTKHNLSSGAPGTNPNKTDGTTQICVFCHTPHGSDTSAPVPLWNRKLDATGFTTYDSLGTSTLDGKVLAVGSVSLACLSCHDGTQAMDTMLNKPGSGGYNAAGSSLGGAWTGNATMSGTPIPVIGKDLTNDHPIGIQYCGGGLTGATTTVSGSCNDSDFVGSAGGTGATAGVQTASINSKQVFWIERNGTAGRQKDDIALYTRDFSGTSGPSVECASCHDPHVESKGTDNIMFMRVTTDGSKICLACHTK